MRQLIHYFIKYPVAGNVIMILIFIFGWWGLGSLKSTFFPDSESKIILVEATYPGASPEEVEEGITTKIEDNLKGLTGLDRVTSISQENFARVTVEVLKDVDTDLIVQDVKNAVDRINSFPAGMEPPVIYKREGRQFVINFALSGDVPLTRLKQTARKIESDFRAMKGISKIQITGFPDEEIQIAFREDALRAYGLSFDQAARAVRQSNIDITGGSVKTASEELLIRARLKRFHADELQSIPIKTSPDGRIVRLRDVAEVTDTWADKPVRSYFNEEQAVIVTIQNTISEDAITISEDVNKYIERFNAQNDGIEATIIRDGTVTLTQRISMLFNNGIIGFVLVVLFLALFLNFRLAFWVAVSIPVAFAGMFILASSFGLTINVISLFGMILVIGILVDDGIVIGESIYQHWERGAEPIDAAMKGTMEVLPAVVSAVLTTIVAFSLFYFLDGPLGNFAPDMAFVVICTLLFSLVEGALILPGHLAHSHALKVARAEKKENAIARTMNNFMAWMRDKVYAPYLRFSLANKTLALAIPLGLFFITLGAIGGGFIKTTFFPSIESEFINVELEMPSGSRDMITEEKLLQIQHAAWAINDSVRETRADGLDIIEGIQRDMGPSSHQGKLTIVLLDNETRDMESDVINGLIQKKTGRLSGAQKLIFAQRVPFGKPVELSLKGPNLAALEGARNAVKAQMNKLSTIKDVADNYQPGLRELNVTLKDKAHLLGLTLQDVLGQVRQGFFGGEVQRLQRGADEVKIWVRYPEADRSSLYRLEDMRIRLANGAEYPFREIAEYEIERGVLGINHLDNQREIRISAELANKEVSSNDVKVYLEKTLLPEALASFPAVSYSFEGQARANEKTKNSMGAAGPAILLLMLAIITLTFRSLWQALLVFFTIPFGLIGVGWGHWLHGAQMSLLSLFGIIALIGIMVNDSLVFISAYNTNMKRGMSFNEAVYNAGISRFRPIILTTLTTVAGLAPLISNTSFQAQFLIPMAIAVAYGLIIATYTTLVMLPVYLVVLSNIRVHLTWLWRGKRPTREELEPAVVELAVETTPAELLPEANQDTIEPTLPTPKANPETRDGDEN